MSAIILGIIFVVVCGLAIVIWEALPIILGAVAVGLIAYLIVLIVLNKKIIETEIIKSEPIMGRRAENTGYSIGYGKSLSYREHYRYKNVQVGERVTFRILWSGGNVTTIVCNSGDAIYKRLYRKLKK